MSNRTINFPALLNGVATDADAVSLSDSTAAFGVIRTDTGESVIAAGTAMTKVGTGLYAYSFAEPAEGLPYAFWVAVTRGMSTTYSPQQVLPAVYVGEPDAAAIAASLLPAQLTGWAAATAIGQSAALAQATAQIDQAMRYQGRRYDPINQRLEFPRIPYESDNALRYTTAVAPVYPYGGEVWDWDYAAQAAVIPARIKQATILQASSLLLGNRRDRLDALNDGLTGQSVGSIREEYRSRFDVPPAGLDTGLCRDAFLLVRNYRIRAGRLL